MRTTGSEPIRNPSWPSSADSSADEPGNESLCSASVTALAPRSVRPSGTEPADGRVRRGPRSPRICDIIALMGSIVGTGDLRDAIGELQTLASEEYGASLEELIENDRPWDGGEYEYLREPDYADALWRLGRLAGIALKKPFANEGPIDDTGPISQTGALRRWELRDHEALLADLPTGPEYRLIQRFISVEPATGELDWLWKPSDGSPQAEYVLQFLEDTNSERGTFRAFAASARRYLCDDAATKEAVKRAQGKVDVSVPTLIATGGADQVAQAITDAIPWLDGNTPRLFFAGLLLILVSQGLNAFCTRTLPPPTTGQVET